LSRLAARFSCMRVPTAFRKERGYG